MLRTILFRTHWLIGLIAGVVLALIGVTGGMMSFEDELLEAINPRVMRVSPRAETPLTPPQLAASVESQFPDKKISSITIEHDPAAAIRVNFVTPRPETGLGGGKLDVRFFDPYTGLVLDPPVGLQFFRTVRELHRWLLLDETGKQITGACVIGLLLMTLSGLYLRWPRRFTDWRAWFVLRTHLKGRRFLWNLHTIVGTWLLLPFLLSALTGLYWSYEWYKDGLYSITGTPKPPERKPTNEGSAKEPSVRKPVDWSLAWEGFVNEVGTYERATLRPPERQGRSLQVTYLPIDAAHIRAFNKINIGPDGKAQQHERYVEKPAGAKLIASNFALHSGEFFGLPGRVIQFLTGISMPLFAITGWLLYLKRRKSQRAAAKRMLRTSTANEPLAVTE